MKVGVTGASGFIGRKLSKKLLDSGYEVKKFVRREHQSEDEIYWSPSKKEIDKDKFKELDAVIHLAGESIAPKDILGFLPFAGGRWNKERKSRIYWSRKWAADLFVETYKSLEKEKWVKVGLKGKKKRKRWVCFRYAQEEFVFARNLSTGNQTLCPVDRYHPTFRTHLRSTSSISMDSGNNLYYVVSGEIYRISISSAGGNFCPDLGAPTRFQRNVNGNVYNLVAKMSIDPQDESIIYATSNTSHTLQKLSINSSNITTTATVGGFGPTASTASNVLFNIPMGLHV